MHPDGCSVVFVREVVRSRIPGPDPLQSRPRECRTDRENYAEHGYGLWIVETHNGEFIGDCGLTWQQVKGAQKLEVGYHVRSDLHGQGFATEAAVACRDYAREDFVAKELITIIHPDNRASERVAEKVGMHRVADDRGGRIPVRTVLSMQL